MKQDRYRKVLNVIFYVILTIIIGLLIYFGYIYFQPLLSSKEASDFVDRYEEEMLVSVLKDDENNSENTENHEENEDSSNNDNNSKNKDSNNNINSTNSIMTYSNNNYSVLGVMTIPKTNFKYPVLQDQSQDALNKAVVVLFGAGLNQPGNTVVIGHNYRNGRLFSNNKKLEIGDQIIVTDNSGKQLSYTIYDKFESDPDDASFYVRDTGGIAELTLSTCTDDSKDRLIILAKAN